MDFDLSEEQQALRAAIVGFASRDLAADTLDTLDRDRTGDFSRRAWDLCAAFGIQGLPVPVEYGGGGADMVTLAVAMEALGYACHDNGLVFSINAQMWACEAPIVQFGTEEQKRRYLPALCSGELIAAHAMTESESGSDAFGMRTSAKRTDDGWVLDGAKTFVSNGPVADVFLVFAVTEPSRGFMGITGFLVDATAPGVTVGSPVEKMGLRTSAMGELVLDGCQVSDDAVLGRRNGGAAVFNAAMLLERSLILASCVGTMQRSFERSLEHARTRHQFGRPIGDNQAVAHRIVDMKLRLETSRLLLHRLAWMLDAGRGSELDAALVKLHLSESFLQTALDAVQIHGGYGYMSELELERDVRDAVAGRLYSGTSDIQRNLAARQLGLRV